jgi:hypothetical protein
MTAGADGTLDVALTLPATLAVSRNYTIEALELENNSAQVTGNASVLLQSQYTVASPTMMKGTVTTYMPTSTPTPTPTPYLTPTPTYCVTLYPASLAFTIIKGTGIAPATTTIGAVFCGSGTVVASASAGISVTPTVLTFSTVGVSVPVTIQPSTSDAAGTYYVTFTSTTGGSPSVLTIVIH